MTVYRIEPPPGLSDLYRSFIEPSSNDSPIPGLFYVGSGKAALDLILSFLARSGVLTNKMSPILMPQWLGTWVYSQTLLHGFPVLDPKAQTPVAVCYHQYGFPQNMDLVRDIARDRRMVLIEDCAHAPDSRYKGAQAGTLGQYSLFSFSKFTFCYALGGVISSNPEFGEFVAERVRHSSGALKLLVNGFKLIDEMNSGADCPVLTRAFLGARSMMYSRYGDQAVAGSAAKKLWNHKRARELAARRGNYQMIRTETDGFGISDHLASDDVAPYAVPLIFDQERMTEVAGALRGAGVEAGQYQFDVARCVFEPDFRRCLLVPVHSGMSGRGMDILLSVLRKALAPRHSGPSLT
jgi:DegT/DnrJ/EryC1/StrS aminotransferase family